VFVLNKSVSLFVKINARNFSFSLGLAFEHMEGGNRFNGHNKNN
jgi:hypothetical protein